MCFPVAVLLLLALVYHGGGPLSIGILNGLWMQNSVNLFLDPEAVLWYHYLQAAAPDGCGGLLHGKAALPKAIRAGTGTERMAAQTKGSS